MNPLTCPLMCLHCEQRPRSVEPRFKSLRLCDRCASVKGLRIIYRRRKGWTRERDRRIQALVERVKAGLPLFDSNDMPQLRLFTAENAESAEKE